MFSAMERNRPHIPLSLDPSPFSSSKMGKGNDYTFSASYDPLVDSSQAKLLSFLQQHISRVQVLDIQVTSLRLVTELFQDIQPTSLNIRSLVVNLKLVNPVAQTRNRVYHIPRPAPDCQHPTCRCQFVEESRSSRWDSRLFSGLTHLRLGRDYRNMPRTPTSQREFLDALHRIRTLRSLDLRGPILPEAVD